MKSSYKPHILIKCMIIFRCWRLLPDHICVVLLLVPLTSLYIGTDYSPQLLATKLVQQDKHPMEKPASQGTSGCKPLTTFVQTDTNAFQDVVQRLTGPSEIDKSQETAPKVAGTKRPTSKLHERRQHTRPKLEIVRPIINFKPCTSPTTPENPCLLASPVGTPSTIFSKLVPTNISPFERETMIKCLQDRVEVRILSKNHLTLLVSQAMWKAAL
uniref:VQ domain-containing protein n=1 Tax=Rhizophora mucronata TaxID=61149 RepID=A0A2P2NZB7_RHIMU